MFGLRPRTLKTENVFSTFSLEVGTVGLVHVTLAGDMTLEDALVGGDTKLEVVVVSAVAADDTTIEDAIADISADVTFGLMALMASAMAGLTPNAFDCIRSVARWLGREERRSLGPQPPEALSSRD